MTELELRFQVPPAQLPSLRQGLLAHGGKRVKTGPPHGTGVTRLACTLVLADATLQVTLETGDRAPPLCELELALTSGDPAALFALAQSWVRHGGLWLQAVSKSEHGRLRATGHDPLAPVKARVPALHRRMGGDALKRAVVRRVLDQVLANAAAVAAGSRDEEQVHQLRVGLRRLRTALRELAGLGEGADPAWDAVLTGVFRRLGEVRDNETVARSVAPLLLQAGATRLAWDVDTEPPEPRAVVRDPAFQQVLLALLAFSWGDRSSDPPGLSHGDAVRAVRHRLSRLHRRVLQGGERFASLPADEQHRVRKQLKRLRYLAEFVAAWWPQKQVERYLACLRPAQDALGVHNDVAVAAERFRQDARKHPESLFSAGYLQAHLRDTGHDAHAALKAMGRARRFWKG